MIVIEVEERQEKLRLQMSLTSNEMQNTKTQRKIVDVNVCKIYEFDYLSIYFFLHLHSVNEQVVRQLLFMSNLRARKIRN